MTSSNVALMKVGNTGFLIDSLRQGTHKNQYLRELYQNAVESGATEVKMGGTDLGVKGGPMKMFVADNGCGMDSEEMLRYLNNFALSGKVQGLDDNFGIGARISTLMDNPHGVVYMSWRSGIGNMLTLIRTPEGQYGIHGQDGEYIFPAPEHLKPKFIKDHGTMVILMGEDDHSETALNVTECSNYFRFKYFETPIRITHNRWENPQQMPVLMPGFSDTRQGTKKGIVDLPDALVHWFVFGETKSKKRSRYGFGTFLSRTVAVKWKNELYDVLHGDVTTSARMSQFGIRANQNRVALIIEPKDNNGNLIRATSNRSTAFWRADPHGKFPYHRWADEFQRKMPQEIQDLIDEHLSSYQQLSHEDLVKALKQALKDVPNEPTPRYKKNKKGDLFADMMVDGGGESRPRDEPTKSQNPSGTPGEGGTKTRGFLGNLIHDGQRSKKVRSGFDFGGVIIEWRSIADRDDNEELYKQAAIMSINALDNTVTITANSNWAGYESLYAIAIEELPDIDDAVIAATDITRNAMALHLGALWLRCTSYFKNNGEVFGDRVTDRESQKIKAEEFTISWFGSMNFAADFIRKECRKRRRDLLLADNIKHAQGRKLPEATR